MVKRIFTTVWLFCTCFSLSTGIAAAKGQLQVSMKADEKQIAPEALCTYAREGLLVDYESSSSKPISAKLDLVLISREGKRVAEFSSKPVPVEPGRELPGDTFIPKDSAFLPGDTFIPKDSAFLPGDTFSRREPLDPRRAVRECATSHALVANVNPADDKLGKDVTGGGLAICLSLKQGTLH